jgi:hypothetical membrane protein
MSRGALSLRRASGERVPRLGPFLYLSSLQYFVVQLVVSLRWSPAYNLQRNTISDLGNTACGRFNGRFVCSPLHTLMNVSFIILGATMIAGSVLIGHALPPTRARKLGFSFLTIAGVGVVVVGIFPENTVSALHGLGATLPFTIGNVGVIVLGLSLALPRALRLVTLSLGTIALAALVFYASSHYLGLGEGGIERLVAYPQTVWLMLLGSYLLTQGRPTESTEVS